MSILIPTIVASLFLQAAQGGAGDPTKVKPLAEMQGHDTLIRMQLIRMIRDQKAWGELWTMHRGSPTITAGNEKIINGGATKPPDVDFTKNQVLIVFGGQMTNIQAIDYVATVVKDGVAVIQLAPKPYVSGDSQTLFLPYIMLVLPREPVRVEVDLDTTAKDGTHSWTKVALFAPPKDIAKSNR